MGQATSDSALAPKPSPEMLQAFSSHVGFRHIAARINDHRSRMLKL